MAPVIELYQDQNWKTVVHVNGDIELNNDYKMADLLVPEEIVDRLRETKNSISEEKTPAYVTVKSDSDGKVKVDGVPTEVYTCGSDNFKTFLTINKLDQG